MRFKRIMGKVGKFAGKAALTELGITSPGPGLRLNEEVRQELAECVYHGVLSALRDFEGESDPQDPPRGSQAV